MKVLLKIFIPLCILSFIAFGISIPILGTDDEWYTVNEPADRTIEITENFNEIEIDVSGYDCEVKPCSGDIAKVSISGDTNKRIKAKVSGNKLKVYSQVKWISFRLDFWNYWNHGTNIIVEVPEKIYEELSLNNTSGNSSSTGISAKTVKLHATSGSIKYDQPDGFTTDSFKLDITSGNVSATNVATKKYDIHETSGEINISGLTGEGAIQSTSGDIDISFASLDGDCKFRMTSGDARLIIPEGSSADIVCKKTSGDIIVSAGGTTQIADKNSTIRLGDGKFKIDTDITSGHLEIRDGSTTENAAVTTMTYGTTMTAVTGPEDIAEIIGDNVESALEMAGSAISDAFDR